MRKRRQHYTVHNEPIKSDQQLLNDIFSAASAYNRYAGKKLLFVYRIDHDANVYAGYETFFGKENFMHLAGIRALNFGALRFYEKCLDRTLKLKEITFTTSRKVASTKLDALPNLLLFHHATIYKMGDADLVTLYNKFDMGLGSNNGMMGFDHRNDVSEPAIPVTLIKAPLTDYVSRPHKVVAVLMKNSEADVYDTLIGCAKSGIRTSDIPSNLQKAISPEILRKMNPEDSHAEKND